ncbi:hypothetical protein SAMN02745823_02546 [Sporobacter termitidis DSM 10068]|uniref:Uncharacterized protein n=1 Tax=Sporobacter termitidis DSM 10068 TaxID=1123282 RepID=A0A1M5YJ01_9FIRM|nr:hypothetical protein [Sporobacter termitidis]SHI11493.1 hypothetical protein SAMN02745823_02546 [Sporobacter termitidis DSM 10068]
MTPYIANNIEIVYVTQGLTAAQDRYRAWFINTSIYSRYKAGVDVILTTDNYGDCIVTE